jgi:hypothetical protein
MQTHVSDRLLRSGLCPLESTVVRFLQTHREGEKLLREFIASEPADRTEEEFKEEQRQANAARETALQRVRQTMLARQLAGLPLIDEALLLVKATGD